LPVSTHPKNIGQIDAFRKEKGENNTSLKPPPSFETDICFLSELLFKTSTIYPATGSKEALQGLKPQRTAEKTVNPKRATGHKTLLLSTTNYTGCSKKGS